ncbi:hypothetical protein Tco_1372559 [Tanacetum coccineum]
MLLEKYSKLFRDKKFTYEVRKRLLNFIFAAFHQSLEFVAILKAIREHGGGGASHKDAAHELFESLEVLLYENLSSSRLGVGNSILGSSSTTVRRSSQLSLLSLWPRHHDFSWMDILPETLTGYAI